MRSVKIFELSIIIAVICWFITFVFWKDKAVQLVKEDGIIEWTQVFLLIVSVVYCLMVVKGHHVYYNSNTIKVCFLVCLVLLVFVIGEEISWGQRIFGIQSPDFVKEINKQHEINLHNLKSVQRFRHWLLIIVGIVGLITIYHKAVLKILVDQWLLPILQPPGNLTVLFVLVLAAGLFVEAGDLLVFFKDDSASARSVRSMAGRTSEIAELFVAIIACRYLASKYHDMRRGNWEIREFLSQRVAFNPTEQVSR